MFQNMENIQKLKEYAQGIITFWQNKVSEAFEKDATTNTLRIWTMARMVRTETNFYVAAGSYTASIKLGNNYYVPIAHTTAANLKNVMPGRTTKIDNATDGTYIQIGNVPVWYAATPLEFGGMSDLYMCKSGSYWYLISTKMYSSTQNATITLAKSLYFAGGQTYMASDVMNLLPEI